MLPRDRRCRHAVRGSMPVLLAAACLAGSPARGANEGPGVTGAPTADVRLVGAASRAPELAALLKELLAQHGIATRSTSQTTFDTADLLEGRRETPDLVAFVVLDLDHRARLYFRAPAGDRFLLREVTLPNDLDAMGREVVAQIVETSVDVLLRTPLAGMTRAQMRSALANTVPPSGLRSDTAPSRGPRIPEAPPRWVARFTLRYSAAWWGPALKAGHGPGLEAGFAARLGRSRGDGQALMLGATALVERPFTQALATPVLDASIDPLSVRWLVDLDWTLGAHELDLRAGGGADFIQASPTRAHNDAVTLAPATTRTVPALRLALGYAVGGASWRVSAEVFADVALLRSPYELAMVSGSTTLASPWSVRPGVALSVSYRVPF